MKKEKDFKRLNEVFEYLKVKEIKMFPDSKMATPTIVIKRGTTNGVCCDCGKGITKETAFLSCLYESIERFCAEHYCEVNYKGLPSYDNNCFIKPSDFYNYKNTKDNEKINWVKCDEIIKHKKVYVPLECIAFPCDSDFYNVSTIGLSSGKTLDEAILHAIYEILEHDILSTFLMANTFAKKMKKFPENIETILSLLKKNNVEFDCLYLDNIYKIPCVLCLITKVNDLPIKAAGIGCNIDLEVATIRAITEAQQSFDYWNMKYEEKEMNEINIVHPPLYLRDSVIFSKNEVEYKTLYNKIVIHNELNLIIQILSHFTNNIIVKNITDNFFEETVVVKVLIPNMEDSIDDNFLRSKGTLLKKDIL